MTAAASRQAATLDSAALSSFQDAQKKRADAQRNGDLLKLIAQQGEIQELKAAIAEQSRKLEKKQREFRTAAQNVIASMQGRRVVLDAHLLTPYPNGDFLRIEPIEVL